MADVARREDALLDKISELLIQIQTLEIENAVLRTEVGR